MINFTLTHSVPQPRGDKPGYYRVDFDGQIDNAVGRNLMGEVQIGGHAVDFRPKADGSFSFTCGNIAAVSSQKKLRRFTVSVVITEKDATGINVDTAIKSCNISLAKYDPTDPSTHGPWIAAAATTPSAVSAGITGLKPVIPQRLRWWNRLWNVIRRRARQAGTRLRKAVVSVTKFVALRLRRFVIRIWKAVVTGTRFAASRPRRWWNSIRRRARQAGTRLRKAVVSVTKFVASRLRRLRNATQRCFSQPGAQIVLALVAIMSVVTLLSELHERGYIR